jgi:hypothetical protein
MVCMYVSVGVCACEVSAAWRFRSTRQSGAPAIILCRMQPGQRRSLRIPIVCVCIYIHIYICMHAYIHTRRHMRVHMPQTHLLSWLSRFHPYDLYTNTGQIAEHQSRNSCFFTCIHAQKQTNIQTYKHAYIHRDLLVFHGKCLSQHSLDILRCCL